MNTHSPAWVATLLVVAALIACRQNAAPLTAAAPAKVATPAAISKVTPVSEKVDPQAETEPAPPGETPVKPEANDEPKAAVEPAGQPVAAPNAEGAVALVDDTATQLLRERLSPAGQAPAPPASSSEPAPRSIGAVELLLSPTFNLPPADVSKDSNLLPSERLKAPFTLPALDLPPLAFARDPLRPDVPKLLQGPRAYVASPDSARTPHIDRFVRDVEPQVLPADDPSAGVTREVLTAAVPLAVPVLAPPQLLGIPDPFENARAVELRTPPPDADPPAVSHVRPTRPVLTPPPPPKP